MRNTICTVAFAMSVILTVVPARAVTRVFLLAGQSNMAGRGYSPDLQLPYSSPQPAVGLWQGFWGVNQWTAVQPGFGVKASNFGPEISFGYAMHAAFPNDSIYLVKYADEGSSLADDWNPNGISTNDYHKFETTVNAAMQNLQAAGLSPEIDGMLWFQGGADAKDPAEAAAYEKNIMSFIPAVRSDLGKPNLEFVEARINTFNGEPTDNSLVRAAQDAAAAQLSNVICFSTDDLPTWTGLELPKSAHPAGHVTSSGQITLGYRFASQFIPAPEPSTLVLAGIGLLFLLAATARRRR
jgi:hypothetical protein